MTQPEETPVSFIPSNFIEKGKILNGTFDIRNAIESIVLSLAIGIPVFHLPLSLTARIIILCMTALPAAMVALIGIGGESITAFLMNALRFVVNRRVIWRSDSLPEGKPRRKPRFKEPKTKKHRKAEKMAEPSKVMASAPPQSEPDAPAPPKSKKKEHRQFDTSTKRGIKKQAKEDIRYLKWEQKEASRQNGSVELSFTFDASALSGKTLVAFETMTFEDHEVAVHADIKDANQTIYFPEIKTTAKDGSDGDQDVSASKEATIVDTVTYHGLMPGSEYKVIGTLMNKETGEALLKDGKPVTAQAEFKAEKAGGSVEVTFTFDASALAGQDVVVFEKLYYTDGKTEHEIASHEDLKDEGQTVHMTELPKEPETPPVAPPVKTGDETPLLLYAGIAIAALAGASVLGIVYFKRKKKHQ